jgi:hypothetical protein
VRQSSRLLTDHIIDDLIMNIFQARRHREGRKLQVLKPIERPLVLGSFDTFDTADP